MSNSDTTVHVSGLSPTTTEDSLHQFFSFCGKIKSIERQEKTATILFEKESAAKTSLMLDGGTLDNSVIQVTIPATSGGSQGPTSPTTPGLTDHEEIKQEDKPRSAIAAEYLAHGYILGDQAIAKAIALDQKHGISAKFSSCFHKIQERALKPNQPAAAPEAAPPAAPTKGLSSLVNWSQQYYEKALNSKHGAKVKEFYTTTSKQVFDVHSEATRIAEQKTGHTLFQFPCTKKSAPEAADPSAPSDNHQGSGDVKQSATGTAPASSVDEKK